MNKCVAVTRPPLMYILCVFSMVNPGGIGNTVLARPSAEAQCHCKHVVGDRVRLLLAKVLLSTLKT